MPVYVVCPTKIPPADLARIRCESMIDVYHHAQTLHERLARDELTRICDVYSARVQRSWRDYDGWGDGFRVLFAELITRHGSTETLKWNASGASDMGFLLKLPIGWCPLTESVLA